MVNPITVAAATEDKDTAVLLNTTAAVVTTAVAAITAAAVTTAAVAIMVAAVIMAVPLVEDSKVDPEDPLVVNLTVPRSS